MIVPAAVLVAVIAVNDWFGPEPRDSVRLSPLLLMLGAIGLVASVRRAAQWRGRASSRAHAQAGSQAGR
jgi:hypothetical protein